MSKRYGRNQKRAARAAIAKLESHLQDMRALLYAERELLKHNRAETARLNQAADQIISAHHQYSALIPVRRGRPEVRRMPAMSRLPLWDDVPQPSSLEMRVIVLNELRACVDFDRMNDDMSAHMIVNDKNEFAYRFSGHIFDHALPATARQEIVVELAKMLMRELDKRWPTMMRNKQSPRW